MFFGFSAPKQGVSSQRHFQKAHLPVFSKKRPPEGGGVLPHFTRCGTNYLHTTLLKMYPKSNLFDLPSMFLGFSAPRIGGVLTKALSKGSSTRFSQEMAPGWGAFYQISPDVALTTCMQLLLEMTPAICPLRPIPTVLGFSSPKIGAVFMKTFSKWLYIRFISKLAPLSP